MIGELLDSRYKIIQALAAGGFGHTYIAEDTRIPGNPKCIVKHLKPASSDPNLLPTARRLFLSEAETLARLGNHDQIPRLLAYFEANQEFYLVQELIVGHTLRQELIPGQKWHESDVISLLESLLPVLRFIHQQDVIHRDIKPDNIIRREHDGKLVLIDFGAVKQLRSDLTTTSSQASVTVSIGTPGYMATEQSQGKPRPNSDIYALGMICIQALTGLPPEQIREDLNTGELLWQDDVSASPGLVGVLTKMVRYHFKDRYQTAAEVLHGLEQLAHPPTVPIAVAATTPQYELTLEWIEGGQRRVQKIRQVQPTKNPGTFRIGRDPVQCDLVLSDPTISALHVEIFFNVRQQYFYLRNLRPSNPPLVNGQSLPTTELLLSQGNSIQLGQTILRVATIVLTRYPAGYQPPNYPPPPPVQPPTPVRQTLPPPQGNNSEKRTLAVSPASPPVEPIDSSPNSSQVSRSSSPAPIIVGISLAAVAAIAGGLFIPQLMQSLANLGSPQGCLATIKPGSNVRVRPNGTIIEALSVLPETQQLAVTGNSTGGGSWVEVVNPAGGSAWAHTTVIENYSELNSCQQAKGTPFQEVSLNPTPTSPKPTVTNPPIAASPKPAISPQPTPTPAQPTPTKQPETPPPDEGVNLLAQAKKEAEAGNWEGAIATAKKIPQSSPSYQDAQKTINQWQSQLEQLEQQLTKLRERAQELEKSGDVAGAIAIYEKIKETSQQEGSQVYGKAQEAISRLWQRLEQQQNEKNEPKDEVQEPKDEVQEPQDEVQEPQDKEQELKDEEQEQNQEPEAEEQIIEN
ncbi:MAG: protein kinase [Symploca sp. SIO1A3]|nr:protein kinase [Symploca sp. SIO1A3]